MFWTPENLLAGLCTVADLGKPRPASGVVVPPVVVSEDDLAKPLREVLRGAALKAFLELGPVEFLKANPDLLGKMLARYAAPEPYTPPTPQQQDWPEWLTARRLAYQESAETAADVDIADAVPRALPKPSARNSGDPVLPPPDSE